MFMNLLCKAYGQSPGSAGLYLLLPQGVRVRDKIVELWRTHVLTPLKAHEIRGPTMIPSVYLVQSGHKANFGDQLFQVGSHINLRPETAQTIFSNYKVLRRQLKGNPLVIAQVGLAYRDQKTTRTGPMRLREFEQMEVQVFQRGGVAPQFLQLLRSCTRNFFKVLGLDHTQVVISQDLPHYSRQTIDLYVNHQGREWQVGCINQRGTHDVGKVEQGVQVLQLSMGLTRLVSIVGQGFDLRPGLAPE